MRKKLLATLIAGLFVATPAMAQDDEPFRLTGSVSLGPIYNNQSVKDAAKLDEYQDLGNGALSNISIYGRGGRNWIDAYGENFGRNDQYMFMRGGQYDVFKYGVYLNSMPHYFALSALTPYAGVGSGLLVTTFPQTNPGTWNSFTLGYKRTDNGGFFEWQRNSPWYFRADGNQVKFDGTKVGSASNGTSPGNGYVDLSIPTQYKTDNFGLEAGYQSKTLTVALRWDYSKFDNAIQQVNWTNPFFGNRLDTSYLPPDNTFNKIGLTANYRGLPMNSVLSARYTYSQTKSSVDLAQSAINGATIVPASELSLPNVNTFEGKKINQSLALAWTANPAPNVDTRAYYYFTKLANDSTDVVYAGTGLSCGGAPCENELFSYRKNNVGADVWWRFARNQRLGGGIDYFDLNQNRVDYDEMKTTRYWVEYKNSVVDNLTAKVKYQYIDRTSNRLEDNEGVNAGDPAFFLRYVSAFDMQALRANQLKLMLDWSPMPLWGVSLEAAWKDNNYQDVTFGRTNDKRQEYYVTVAYGDADSIRVSGFADYEIIKYPSDHRFINAVPCNVTSGLFCYDPNAAPNALAYNWSSATKDRNWSVGLGLDWPVSPKWLVKASYMYLDSNGSADFASQNNFGNPIAIPNFDDTTRHSFNLKGIYAASKAWSYTLGYAYEKWHNDDVSYNGYQYTIPFPAVTNNTSQSYLNGYNAFVSGRQNIFYGLVSYRF